MLRYRIEWLGDSLLSVIGTIEFEISETRPHELDPIDRALCYALTLMRRRDEPTHPDIPRETRGFYVSEISC